MMADSNHPIPDILDVNLVMLLRSLVGEETQCNISKHAGFIECECDPSGDDTKREPLYELMTTTQQC